MDSEGGIDMVMILIIMFVATTVVLAYTIDPEVRRCEYCSGPITFKELLQSFKKCPKCREAK